MIKKRWHQIQIWLTVVLVEVLSSAADRISAGGGWGMGTERGGRETESGGGVGGANSSLPSNRLEEARSCETV